MSKRIIDVSRRQVLLGLGGMTLALPVLPSLLTKTAYGADPVLTSKPRLFWVTTDHGGCFESSFFPGESTFTDSEELFSDHTIKHGALQGAVEGDDRVVSAVLRGPQDRFSEALLAKMNVLYGLDVPFYIAHSTGIHLGNYARNDGNGEDGVAVQDDPRPTIDQVLAWSNSFYPDLTTIRERAMIMSERPVSWGYSDPVAQSGTIEQVRGLMSSRDLFNKIFVPPETDVPSRPPIVDAVLESYKTLRNGNRRLSAADKQRLDDHMARLAELERKLNTVASCGDVPEPTDDANRHTTRDPVEAAKLCQLFNDVVAAAFVCGTSRIGVLGYGSTESFSGFGGDWHNEVAHKWQSQQEVLVRSYQAFFANAFLDLAAKLDVEETPGVTYLDNSLLVWTQESGMETHGSASVPVVTFGGAAGFFKTGRAIDYRRYGNQDSQHDPRAGGMQYLGLLYNQWLATVMRSMGLQPEEFERWGHKGYGVPFVATGGSPPYHKHYVNSSSRYFQMASDVLPLIAV
jgi:hypothetical protein